jgi:thiol-disulfide isomerase/thioredoxin
MKKLHYFLVLMISALLMAGSCSKSSTGNTGGGNGGNGNGGGGNTTPITYPTHLLIDQFTGTWCGHCPRLSKKLTDLLASNNKIHAVSIHNGDPMAISLESTLRSQALVTGFPTGKINRTEFWGENAFEVAPYLAITQNVGVAIESAVSGTTISGKVKVLYGKAFTASTHKLHVYLVEDGIVASQTNYGYWGLPNPISGYVHNNVLRQLNTGVLGVDVTATSMVNGGSFDYSYTFNATGYNTANCKIIAFVTTSDAGVGVVNANATAAGTNVTAN